MGTLYDYLASLLVGGSPLVWSFRPLTEAEISAANGLPYARVHELGEMPVGEMYSNQEIYQSTVDVAIYQAPSSTGVMPSRENAMHLYYDLLDAVNEVDEHTYGQTLIAMHRDITFPPTYDEDSGGLRGLVRFRLLFPRG